MADSTTRSEDLWNPYKELQQIVLKHLSGDNSNLCNSELESTLRKHKQNFFALLQNPQKNAKSREELKKGMVEGIAVRGLGHQILSKELYQEALIISDMYDMNEFVALDLLCTAQLQMSYHPGLPRGLVAILLYYDGRKALLSALRCLVQARTGVQWSVDVKEDIIRYITLYTDQLMEGGLFDRIFELLRTLDLSKEIEKLHQNLALGGPKHRKQVTDLFMDIRNILADIVFIWSTQCGLPKGPTLSLIGFLREVKIEEEASGKLDQVSLSLQMALLAALDLSILHTREDGEEVVQSLPILADKDYVESVVNEFSPMKPKWNCEGLQAVSSFGLAVCVGSLRLVPQNPHIQNFIGKEEILIEKAIELNIFEFLHDTLLETKLLYKDEYMYKRMHYLMTDFIVYLYPKVKELRIKADEIARTIQVYMREGLEAPMTLPKHFEYLLLSIAKLYHNNVLKSEYVLDYWSPIEINPNQLHTYRAPPRAVSLFKFIRFAGDMLPSTLFVPYVTMLSSLSTCQQAARNCFNMLRQVGNLLSSTLSWDHFFMSFAQYYSNLRQETPAAADTVYGHKYHKLVSPQEIKGLQAVLLLIRTVADNDEFSRLALCEHPGWAPLTVLLGLVSCSVTIPLKADLLLTLAALSKSPENASQMWENLEASQIIVTIPTTSNYNPRGIETELEEIESRNGEYPLTIALLKLLDTLTDLGIPRTLGAGPRKPGFDPYLLFIINSVFLKFGFRSYKSVSEKWQVASLCLKLFEKFLKHYEPHANDFAKGVLLNEFNAPPGYHLMIQLNNKTEMLNTILDIVHEGCRCFDTYTTFPGEEMLAESTLHCLNVINRVLVLKPIFFTMSSASSESVLLTNITKLLLTINRRSGKPDHCINMAKYLNYHYQLPKHANSAIKNLNLMFSSPVTHNHFVNILFSMDETNKQIKYGFIECLDATTDEEDSDTVQNTKLEILKLLKQCLSYGAPNFSHFLLGFDIKRDISKSDIQMPGVLDHPRSCLHCIFGIMNAAVGNNSSVNPELLESVYHMLYLLVSNVKTSGPVLRFIKMNENFFRNQLTYCYKHLNDGISELNQMSWLMKSVATELKVSSRSKQVKYLKELCNFLIGAPRLETLEKSDFAALSVMEIEEVKDRYFPWNEQDYFMKSLVQYFEAKDYEVEMPQWEYFNSDVLSARIKSCQTDQAPQLIDIKKLHQILNDELKTLQSTAIMGQIQAVGQEISRILKYALEVNKVKERGAAVIHFVDAWRQIIEVIVTYIPTEILSSEEQQYFSIHLALHLLRRVIKVDLLSESCKFLSGAILLLLDNVKKCHVREQKLLKVTDPGNRAIGGLQVHSEALKEILKILMEWVMVSTVTSEKLKINIYGCIVTFLQLTNMQEYKKDLEVLNSTYVTRLDSSIHEFAESNSVYIPTEIVTAFGDKLVEVLCHDCLAGHEICQVLAMSSFGLLISLTSNVNWILYMSSRGYHKHVVQSILDSNNDLRSVLEPSAVNIKPLYLFNSKIVFLIKIAATRLGAELLLEQKLLSCLSNMNVFDNHPEISKVWNVAEDLDSFLPSLEEQYLQIWLPTFDLCNAILTTLGTDNKSAIVQIMHYIFSHLDVIELVLRSGSPELPPSSLKELALITSVISRSANNDLVNILENEDIVQNHRAQLFRIQKLMLALIPKFTLSESTVRDLVRNPVNVDVYQTSDRLLYAMQIISNLLFYCRNTVANHGVEHAAVGIIFEPTLNTFSRNNTSFYEQVPSLGVIVQHLISTVSYQHQEKVTLDLLLRNIKDIPDMNSIELRDLIDESRNVADITTMRQHVYEIISHRLEKKKKEMEYCSFIIEHALYLIWLHLDYYMLKAIPRVKHFGPPKVNASLNMDTTLPSASEATWKVTTDDISKLKQGLVSIFNDSFSKQLLETAQDRPEADKGLAEALLRKIKRLIQFVPVK